MNLIHLMIKKMLIDMQSIIRLSKEGHVDGSSLSMTRAVKNITARRTNDNFPSGALPKTWYFFL